MSLVSPLRQKFAASAIILASLVPANDINAQAPTKNPITTLTHANNKTNTFDMRLLISAGGRIHFTKEAITAFDINSQVLNGAHSRELMLAATPAEFQKMSDDNFKFLVAHLAQTHQDCIQPYVRMKKAAFKKHAISASDLQRKNDNLSDFFEERYGSNWESLNHCTLSDLMRKAYVYHGLTPAAPAPTPDPSTH